VRFRSHRGASHSAFRAHKGGFPGQQAFSAHVLRAIKVRRAKAAKTAKLPKAAAFKSALKKAPAGWVKPRTKAASFKSALRQAPKPKTKAAKYKAARGKRV